MVELAAEFLLGLCGSLPKMVGKKLSLKAIRSFAAAHRKEIETIVWLLLDIAQEHNRIKNKKPPRIKRRLSN